MKCLACDKNIEKKNSLDRVSLTCSTKCWYNWTYKIHFVDHDWHIPTQNTIHFIDLQFFKGGRLRG